MKGRDEMHATNDLLGFNESKSLRFVMRIKTDTGQTAYSPACLQVPITCEPSHPQEINMFGHWSPHFRANIPDINMKYSDDSRVPVGVGVLDVFV